MKEMSNSLNTYFWNVGNDIADIRLLAEGALALYEGDAEPLHRLGMRNNEEVAALAFDTIGSNSIVNQKSMLQSYADQHGFANCVHYTDAGSSGTG